MNKYLCLLIFIFIVSVANAQTSIKEFIETCPEMEVGKIYTGKELVDAKQNFPNGTKNVGFGRARQYPFAKITSENTTVIFTFTQLCKTCATSMHCYLYDSKNYRLISGETYLCQEGKVQQFGTYEGFLKLNTEGEIIVQEKLNGKLTARTKTRIISNKGFRVKE